MQDSSAMHKQPQPARHVREMNEDGRPADGLCINAGDRFLTRFGTPTTPFPHQRHERYASQWLIDNATAHAQAAGDRLNAAVFGSERPAKTGGDLPPASAGCMLLYLFGTDVEAERQP